MPESVTILARRCGIGQWSFIGPGSEKRWYSMEENSPQGIWDHIADEMLVEFAESGCPIFRANNSTVPGVNSEAKDMENFQFTLLPTRKTIETFSHNCFCQSAQFSRSSCKHVWRIWIPSNVLMGQSIVLSKIKAEVPLKNIPSHQNLLLQQYEERIELLSQEKQCV